MANAKDIGVVICARNILRKIPRFVPFASMMLSFFASAQVDLRPTVYLPGINDPQEIAVGDFDGNGLQDALISLDPVSGMVVFYSTGSGQFSKKNFSITSDKARSSKIAVADLNKDGKDDFVILDEDAEDGGNVLACISAGFDFEVKVISDIDNSNWDLVVVDFDRDGDKDIVLAGLSKWLFLKGNGAGNFTASSTAAWPEKEDCFDFSILDVNNDEILDFVFVKINSIKTWHSNGSQYSSSELTFVGNPSAAIFEDFSGDNFPDVVILKDNQTDFDVLYFINNANNNFEVPITLVSGYDFVSLDHFDYDNNDKEDIVVGNAGSGQSAFVLQNLGANTFSFNPIDDNQSTGVVDVKIAEVDGTGAPEILTVSSLRTLSVFEYSGAVYETDDVIPFGIGCSDGAVYDLDNDGLNDIIGAGTNGAVAVWYGKGDMTFEDPVFHMFFGKIDNVEVADFNEDDIGDIVFTAYNPITTQATVMVLQSIQERLYTTTEYSDDHAFILMVGDINNDNFTDFVTDRQVFRNDGNWNFNVTDIDAPGAAVDGALGYFDNNAFMDLVVSVNGNLQIALNNGSGGFDSFTEVDQTDFIYHIKAVDLNDDGFTDLAGTITLENGQAVAILLQSKKDGTFTQTRRLPVPLTSHFGGADVGDMNNDNIPDLVMDQQYESTAGVSIYLGKEDGGYNDPLSFDTDNELREIFLGSEFSLSDVNKDSRMDALVFSTIGAPAAILEGATLGRPTVAPSGLAVVPGSTSATISLTKGNGNGRLITMRKRIFIEETSDPSGVPEDGALYSSSTTFGDGFAVGSDYVVMRSDETTVTVDALEGSSYYYVFAYEYDENERHSNVNYYPTFVKTQFHTDPVPQVTGLTDDEEKSFSISPNPVGNIATVTFAGETISDPVFFNALGQRFDLPIVRQKNSFEVNTSSLPPGFYILTLSHEALKFLK